MSIESILGKPPRRDWNGFGVFFTWGRGVHWSNDFACSVVTGAEKNSFDFGFKHKVRWGIVMKYVSFTQQIFPRYPLWARYSVC